jgi:dTDP-4-dehydrorhamnose reductase
VEIARILAQYVIPDNNLSGLYHLSSVSISKYDLLSLISNVYQKEIVIHRNNELIIDRSLDSSKFRLETGFEPKSWKEMIRYMHNENEEAKGSYDFKK